MALEITNSILSLQPAVEAETLAPQSFHWQLEDYAYFHKCGEITSSPDVQCFGFNCAFCPAICLQLSVFIDHIRGQHMQDMRRRYEGAEEKIEQTTQTDFNLMIRDMHREQMDTTPALTPAMATTNTRLDKRTKKPNWNEAQGAGLLDMGLDLGLDLANMVQAQSLPKTSNNNATLLQLGNTNPTTTTTTATMSTPADLDLVYVMENPLPPSPPPSADISSDGNSPSRLHQLDPFEMLHEAVSSVEHTATPTLFEAVSRGGHTGVAPPRYETRRVSESTESEKSSETDSESTTKSAQYREVLSCIIDAFRRQESLWNPQHFDYNNCCKKELYREISAELLEELNYEMTGEECYKELQKLRTRYRKELRMVIKHKGLYLPKLWCYDELEFLQKILQDQIFNKISKKKGVVETNHRTKFIDASSISFVTQDDQLQFVEIYRNYPALWDVDHPDFRSNAYRSQALAQMLDELNTTFQCSYTSAELEKTLFELRKDFSAQKRKILTNVSGSSSVPLLHAKLGQFLEPNLGPFRCDVCAELVKTCDQYKVHRAGHDGTQPFICTLCGKGFQMPCNLTVHIRRHRHDFPYACEQCDKRFATSTEVAIHMRTHTGERPYICDLCGKSFKTWSFFDIHRRTHLNQSSFHCPICDKGFYEKNRFTDHMNGHLNIRKHLCTVCGKTFTTYGNLKKHTELHLAVKKYKCTACGKRFAQFASLRWHKKREHTSEQQQLQLEEVELEVEADAQL
ncbi:uncharacterized protein rgr isoform X2 [Drosophila virilis]|uniref:uncharacterized protein rgr isoform X2 n=1 Tax=Drosophila virilis TaxID=7244 RepID=UPI001396053C|nr:zinc finger and BTB domain-containing protein 41 isoform X2 [Drosophila virilis]